MKTLIQTMMLLGTVAMIQPAMADNSAVANSTKVPGQHVEQRVVRQNHRIDRKLKKKKISAEQAQQLKSEVQAVQAKKNTMLKEGNGKLTRAQHKELHQDLKKSSQDIKSAGAQSVAQ